MEHQSNIYKQASIKCLLELAKILGFNVTAPDVKPAYQSSAFKLHILAFITTEFINLAANELL